MYILADIKKNVENQDLYRKKDDFWVLEPKLHIFLK